MFNIRYASIRGYAEWGFVGDVLWRVILSKGSAQGRR
jgi:hypothetical protein